MTKSKIDDQRLMMKGTRFNLKSLIFPLAIIITLLGLYVATLAQSLVLGDPSEYTMITAVLGIAHPPGYAFYTVLGKLFQTLIPFGEIPWRMHLLSAVTTTVAALALYGTVVTLGERKPSTHLVGVFTGLLGGTAVNIWQHAIHANPHIITGTFLVVNVFFLTKWWADQQRSRRAGEQGSNSPSNKWLYAFSLSAGLGVTHHPLTVFGFPAYAIFILLVWIKNERLMIKDQSKSARFNLQSLIINPFQRHWRTILAMLACALLGLSVWIYYPLRSPSAPFGPTTMNTLDGFLAHVLARGLSESLPYYPLNQQFNRLIVFWSILRLQYALPVIGLALLGVLSPLLDKVTRWQGDKVTNHPLTSSPPHPLTLSLFAFATTYAFVISLRAQDIMAYLLGPLLLVALFAGMGLLWLMAQFRGKWPVWGLMAAAFIVGPVLQVAQNLPNVSLRDYREGADVVDNAFTWFDGSIENATLLNNWEVQTPLWYQEYVNGRTPAHVTPIFIATGGANPWLEGVFANGLPLFTHAYRPEILAGTEFRLRPRGPYYQVAEPGDATLPPELLPVQASAEAIELVGALLPETAVTAGDYVPLTLAFTTPTGTADYYVPVVRVGDIAYPFTTDSHLITPRWVPGEIIVERFDFALPHNLPAGRYPVSVDLKNLSTDTDLPLNLSLGTLTVAAHPNPPQTADLLANFRQRVGLVDAVARGAGNGRTLAPWSSPLTANPGDTIHLTLRWRALDKAEESYTVFVHLIDLANQPLVALDYTPLGGAMPTHLWIPKWLPGQEMRDPYSLQIPPDLPPGQYLIEVGFYEMVGLRRLHLAAADGSLVGDRYILGSVVVGNGE